MPIKLPKGFQRRKSSGNALDELSSASAAPAGSSFRVLERPALNKSYDGNLAIRSSAAAGGLALSQPRSNSFDRDEDDLFSVARPDAGDRYDRLVVPNRPCVVADQNRSSGGTDASNPPSQHPSGASSSRRSTSTNPSSIESHPDQHGQLQLKDVPAPPAPSRPGFLRHSTHTFTLTKGLRSANKDGGGGGGGVSNAGAPEPAVVRPFTSSAASPAENSRSRALTASSASTATPPRLFDAELGLDRVELDGFGNMFDGIGVHSSREQSPSRRPPSPSQRPRYPPSSFAAASRQPAQASSPVASRTITAVHNERLESSPAFSASSHDSYRSLLRSPSPSRTITQASRLGSPSLASTNVAPFESVAHASPSSDYDDGDDDLVPRHSSQSNGHPQRQRTGSPSVQSSSISKPDNEVDPSLAASAALWSRFDSTKATAAAAAATTTTTTTTTTAAASLPPKAGQNKVMTPAQFERYKREQELDRRVGPSSEPEEDDTESYEDDDDDEHEVEKEKQASRQRKKQEAHLAVYRQQMMKVTGEQSELHSGPSSSTTNLLRANSTPERLSSVTASTKESGGSSGAADAAAAAAAADEEEDEDVPLGILAAHGFPNKNRPPTRLSQSSSNPNLRSIAQTQGGAGSVVGSAADAAKRGSLPPFARNLPQDPYFGASLVNPVHREPLSMHVVQAPPMLQPISGSATLHPHHPAGLVGVIAGEEKARALRRGSPNNYASAYDLPPSMQHPALSRASVILPGMIPPHMMGMPAMLSPSDHAQIQMNHQVGQMMQMQLQWMQQMTQMMGSQMGGQPAQPGQQSRPQSVMQPLPPLGQQRTMSTLTPSMSNWHLGGGGGGPTINAHYAASLAPSERSNVGLASRYRPVSTGPDFEPATRRASTFTSATLGPWSSGLDSSNNSRPGSHVNAHVSNNSSNSPGGRKPPLSHIDDDDDEQAWAEMKAKKETKQKTWKLRKGKNNVLQELYNGVS